MQCDERVPPSFVDHPNVVAADLPRALSTPELTHGLDDPEEAAARARVSVREHDGPSARG